MGNNSSTVLLVAEPDWEEYVQKDWRSERVKELDALGGE